MRKRVLVVAGIALRGEKVFLAKRPPGKHMAGMWEFPGGKIEPGETPEAALARELQEELGVDIEIDALLDAITWAYPDFDLLMLLYGVRFLTEPKANEAEAIGWFSFDEAVELPVPPADIPVIAKLIDYRRKLTLLSPSQESGSGV